MLKKDYNFFQIQNEIKNKWDLEGTNNTVISNDFSKFYSIDTPPPTVSGNFHIGHVFSYTQTDIIARYKRMSGFNVFYPFGFDDNGLPTERYVEKKLNINPFSMTRKEFKDLCLKESKEVHNLFIDLWKNLGFSIDWRYCYSTISKEVQSISQKSFIELYKKGFIYQKEDPALYCTACKTSVSQADLEEVEKETFFTTIPFFIERERRKEEILIATTRPELLSGCVAIFFNPEDERYKNLEGKKALVPIYNFEVPILADEKVIKDKGTGLVMCCTFGDSLDVFWFKKHKLQYKKVIGLDGKLTSISGFLQGLSVFHSREAILKKLEEEKLIRNQIKIKHSVAIYERSKKEIEYVMLKQWFVKILDYKKDFIDFANNINWYPMHMKSRCIDWIENLNWDWCISRQRFSGVPFPVWYDKNGNIILADFKDLPVDPIVDIPKGYLKEDLVPDEDVMDTWNTSSLTPLICKDSYQRLTGINNNNFLPMTIRPQAHDIIRTWAFDTIVKAWMHEKSIPWKDIIISGHVLSTEKQKISKSQGNSPLDPSNLIKLYPADAIRYWTASTKLGTDTAFSEDRLKNGNRLLVKIWNSALCILNNADFDNINKIYNVNIALECNKWILSNLKTVYIEYKKHFEENEFSLALEKIEDFFWSSFCDNYLEIIKVYFFKPELFKKNDIEEINIVSAFVFQEILKMFSPFLVFLTEELYQKLYKKKDNVFKSIHYSLYLNINFINENYEFKNIIQLINKIRKIKSDAKVSLKYEIEKLYLDISSSINKDIFLESSNIIKEMFCIKEISYNQFENNYEFEKIIKIDDENIIKIKI